MPRGQRKVQQPADSSRRVCTQCRVEKDLATDFYKTSPNRRAFKSYGCRMPCIECSKARYAGGPGRGRKRVVVQPDDPSRRVCTQCRTEKPLEEFYPPNTVQQERLYGCAMPCKACSIRRAKEHYYLKGGREKAAERRETDADFRSAQAAYMREFRQKPEAKAAKKAVDSARHAKTRGAPTATLTRKDWLTILEVHDHRCAYCLRPEAECGTLTQDHVVAVSLGGEHTPDNIVPACGSCNSRKSDRPIFFMARYA